MPKYYAGYSSGAQMGLIGIEGVKLCVTNRRVA